MPSEPSVPNDAADFTKVVSSWGAVTTDSKSVYLASRKKYSGELGLSDKTYYISGDMTLTKVWGSGTIYILKGGSLTLNHDIDAVIAYLNFDKGQVVPFWVLNDNLPVRIRVNKLKSNGRPFSDRQFIFTNDGGSVPYKSLKHRNTKTQE